MVVHDMVEAVHAHAYFFLQKDAADKVCNSWHKAKSKKSADIGHLMSVLTDRNMWRP